MTQVLAPPVTDGHRRYGLTVGTELLGEFQDSAYQEPKFLIQRVDGQTMQLPRLLYGVACALDGRGAAEIAEELNARLGQDLTAEQVRFLIEERLYPAGIVAVDGSVTAAGPDDPAGAAHEAPPAPVPMPVKNDLLLALRYRAGVIPAGLAGRIGGVLQPLFARPVWISLVSAFVVVDALIIASGDLLAQSVSGVQAVVERPALLLAILGLTVVSGAIHEFGHVSACRYGGARPGDVGVGLYIVWPALYSDVTDSYRLDRVGRLRTDLGGVYFDAVVMAVVGLVYLHTGEAWLLLALIGMHVETAWQFLPSIRLDGYYILADLVGVPDLFGYVKPTLLSVLPGRPVHPRVAELKPRARRTVILWVLAVVPTLAFWLVLFVLAAPQIIPAAWQSLLDYLQGLDAAVRSGDLVTMSLGVFQMLLLVLPWVGSVLVLWMLVDIIGQKRRARGAVSRISAATTTALRRWAALALVAVVGSLLVARVASVAASHPPTGSETAFADAVLATVHGAAGPPVPMGEWIGHAQYVLYAVLTGAFDRHGTAVAGVRELSVLASAVLVACLAALVALRRLRPLSVLLPLTAVLVMGPAVVLLSTAGPSVLGVAWTALGLLVLGQARGAGARVCAVLVIALGLATEPVVALPLALLAGTALVAKGEPWYRPTWWPPQDSEEVDRAGGRARRRQGRHRRVGPVRPRHGTADDASGWGLRRWSGVVLGVTGLLGAVLTVGREDVPLDGTERTALLAVATVVVVGALASRRWRQPAVATGVLVAVAALLRPGGGPVVVVALVAAALLAVVLIDGLVRLPVPQRPHPLLRGLVVVPAVVLVVVGMLLQPARAPSLPHAQLAGWVQEEGRDDDLAVPGRLWGDLVRAGVPPERLSRAGSSAARTAEWAVEIGESRAGDGTVAVFGTGATALVVLRPAHVEARERAAAAEQAARVAAEQQAAETDRAARQVLGSSLAGNPRLTGPDDVLAALRDGSVDEPVLAALLALTAEHDLTVAAGPGWTDAVVAGIPRRDIAITRFDGRLTSQPEVAAALSGRLAALPAHVRPAVPMPERGGVVVTWLPAAPVDASQNVPAR